MIIPHEYSNGSRITNGIHFVTLYRAQRERERESSANFCIQILSKPNCNPINSEMEKNLTKISQITSSTKPKKNRSQSHVHLFIQSQNRILLIEKLQLLAKRMLTWITAFRLNLSNFQCSLAAAPYCMFPFWEYFCGITHWNLLFLKSWFDRINCKNCPNRLCNGDIYVICIVFYVYSCHQSTKSSRCTTINKSTLQTEPINIHTMELKKMVWIARLLRFKMNLWHPFK